MPWYYLSFADPNKPKGTQFLGAIVIEASDAKDAIWRTHLIGENPGGEVMTWEIDILPPEEYRARLLSLEDIRAVGKAITGKSTLRDLRGRFR
jgi:hypothetical protein